VGAERQDNGGKSADPEGELHAFDARPNLGDADDDVRDQKKCPMINSWE
jgi:hypothetical protein